MTQLIKTDDINVVYSYAKDTSVAKDQDNGTSATLLDKFN